MGGAAGLGSATRVDQPPSPARLLSGNGRLRGITEMPIFVQRPAQGIPWWPVRPPARNECRRERDGVECPPRLITDFRRGKSLTREGSGVVRAGSPCPAK